MTHLSPLAGYLGEIPGPDVEGAIAAGTLVVQPMGAVEHHGPHLPLITDALIAEATAAAVVREHPELDIRVLPTLSYGVSTEHIWAPGTVSLTPATLLSLLDDLGASLRRAGAERLVFLNAHGGNTHVLRLAARELRAKHGLMTFIAFCDLPPDVGGGGDPREERLGIHGGRAETSILLHLRPDLVDMSRALRRVPSWINEYETIGFESGNEFAWLSNDLTDNGVTGDPTLADAEYGRERFEHSVATVARVFAEMLRFRYGAGPLETPLRRPAREDPR